MPGVCVDVWLAGCVDVLLAGCVDVWLAGCVQMFSPPVGGNAGGGNAMKGGPPNVDSSQLYHQGYNKPGQSSQQTERYACIAANPPDFFVIIRKSKLEYEFPNNENPTFFFFFFSSSSPCFVDGTVCPPATMNIHARFLILRCKLQFASRSLCMCAIFSSFRGNAPLPNPPP